MLVITGDHGDPIHKLSFVLYLKVDKDVYRFLKRYIGKQAFYVEVYKLFDDSNSILFMISMRCVAFFMLVWVFFLEQFNKR